VRFLPASLALALLACGSRTPPVETMPPELLDKQRPHADAPGPLPQENAGGGGCDLGDPFGCDAAHASGRSFSMGCCGTGGGHGRGAFVPGAIFVVVIRRLRRTSRGSS
jgi:hypothetical protein